MNPMQPPSLYSICFKKTFNVLKTGQWRSCGTNPFFFLPSAIVNDFAKFALSEPYPERLKNPELLLLISSGRLTELNLMDCDIPLDPKILMSVMSEEVCKNLRSLSMPCYLRDDDFPPVETVFRFCTNLEELHSPLTFDLDILQNCALLRSLRFHLPVLHNLDLRKMAVCAKSLNSLQVFTICTAHDTFSSCKFVAKVLLSCPNLISVGLVDSSLPLKFIHKTKSSTPLRLNLRRCFWGLSHNSYLLVINTTKISTYREEFSELIKFAVLSCPLVEELVINVFHIECLQHLCLLEHLTFLSINFNYCQHDYSPSWSSVLKKIGPQIKHLSVKAPGKIPINVICDNCVNLVSLRIRGKAVVAETVSTSSNLSHLRRLVLKCMDEKGLMFLLSGCPLLTEMFLDCALCVDDTLMSNILKYNPLSELKVAGINACNLSQLGFQMLLESAFKLERVFFRSVKFDLPSETLRKKTLNIIHKFKPRRVNFNSFDELKDIEFFRRKLHPCRF